LVDSLEKSLKEDLAFLGNDVLYIQRFPWGFGGSEYAWWKYFRRPYNTINEYKSLERSLQEAEAVGVMAYKRGVTAKFKSNSMSALLLGGISYDINKIRTIDIEKGRYFTPQEIEDGKNAVIIGADVAQALFGEADPVGNTIKVKGERFVIIGVMKREGENFFGDTSNDLRLFIPYKVFGKMYVIGRRGIEPMICIKGKVDDPGLLKLESEVRGTLRTRRGLKPYEEDNFAINRPELALNAISSLFAVVSIAGWVIGSFSILVGGFGIANIMFVSVKERTNIIGIQKSLGAKNYFILFQFLFEAVFLSLIGGTVGITLVFLLTIIPQDFFAIILSAKNIILGISVASVVGIISGVFPAWIASKLDPVEAIRAK
jgi:putative ABC transport system permease protein